jgi:hypothetical protein
MLEKQSRDSEARVKKMIEQDFFQKLIQIHKMWLKLAKIG